MSDGLGSMTLLAVALPVDSFNVVVLMATYVLVALGLHYSFGLLGIVNLAHGEFLLLGAYTVVAVQQATGSVVLGLVLAPVVAGLVGLVVERVVLRGLHERVLDTLLATFGVSVVVRQGLQVLFTANPQQVNDPIGGSVRLAGLNIPWWRAVVVASTIAAVVATALTIRRTSLGLRWRATVRNPELAETLGIVTTRSRAALFGVGSGLAGLTGALLAPLNTLTPQFGTRFLVPAFLVVILGVPGSLGGLVVSGMVLGGALGIMQFQMSSITAQMLVIVLAIVGIRFRDRLVGNWRGRTPRRQRARTADTHP
jgi:branched-chain amino acid transport system permease protein/urea transport system permease protein